uniref:Uncharacterized protein n=1 Tax=Periophthalmus magnuspinnatus TaxID=409849 RepID=A0A3B3ZNH8_9GOBI
MASLITPLLSVAPTRALVDEKFKVRVKNLPAGLPFTLHSLHLSEDNDYWEAFGHYISNYNGTVCVSEHLSLGGTYTGKEPMGLLWSLRPVPGSRKGLRLRKKNVSSPLLYTISVYSGHLTEGFRDQAPLASVVTERWYMAPGVQRISIKENIVRGTMPWSIPGTPGYVGWWRWLGGVSCRHTGFTWLCCFCLGVHKPWRDGDFWLAFNIVKDHPRVIPNKVGIFGLSFGATVAFYLASESNVPRCCVCINGHTIFSRGKSFAEQSDEDDNHMWRNLFLSRDNTLDMEKINCPVLLVCGEDDQNVPSVEIADDIERTMHAAGKGHLLTRINYPGAGHLIEVPYAPHFRVTAFMQSRTQKIMMLWGGQTKPHSDAQEDSWKKILDYLEHHLFSSPKSMRKHKL